MTQRQPGGQEGRNAAGDDYVCGKVNVYTLATHVEPMCSLRNASSSASHIGGGKKMGGRRRREKKALIGRWPTIPIEISHSQAGCSPEAGGFALETAPVAIFGT